MTRAEITMNSYQKDLDKLTAQLAKAQNTYEKKLAAAQKQGVAEWSIEDHNAWLQTIETNAGGWIINKADIKKNEAWWDLYSAGNRIEEKQDEIKRATARLEKATGKYIAECSTKEAEEIITTRANMADSYLTVTLTQEEIEAMQEQMKAEWLKDGIVITEFHGSGLDGITPEGKKFYFYINNGFTDRSWHCYTLCIDGVTLFTSGTIQSCYRTIKTH